MLYRYKFIFIKLFRPRLVFVLIVSIRVMDNKKSKPFEFQVFSWHCDDGQSYPLQYDEYPSGDQIEHFSYNVHMFGKTHSGKSVCIHVQEFMPTFFIHIPDKDMDFSLYEDIRDLVKKLLRAKSSELNERGKEIWLNFEDHLVEETSKSGIQKGSTLWGFTNFRQDKYFKFSFRSLWAYNRVLSRLKSYVNNYKEMGDDEKSILGKFQLFDVIDPLIRFAHTKNLNTAGWISIDKRHLGEMGFKMSDCDLEYQVSYDHVHGVQREEVCPNLIEMAFDIETYSHNEAFPKPEHPDNVVFQIGITLKKYIDKTIDTKILLHLGNNIDKSGMDGIEVRCFNKEADLLLEFSKIVRKQSPDLLYTWNGDDFDWNYIFVRAELLGVTEAFQCMSRIKDYPCVVKELSFNSSAMGQNVYKHVLIPGRLNLDILTFTKKDAVNKYDNNKLDTVAAKVLGERKDDVHYKDIFRFYKQGDPAKLAIVGKYCIQDTALVQKLVDRTDVVVQLFEMANITYTQVSDLLIRGQQIKVYSQITKAAMDKGFFTPFFKKQLGGDPMGAIVLEPKVGVYRSPVACLDFASLYPTIMMAFNMCYSTLVLDTRYANVPGVKYDDIVWQQDGEQVVVRFAQDVKSIIPELQRSMYSARIAVKKMKKDLIRIEVDPQTGKKIEVIKDELRYRVLTGRELAIKVSMNSIYGFTSAHKLRLALLTGAVTAQGRRMIYQTKDFMENQFPDMCVKNGWTKERPPLEAIGGDSVTGDTPILCREDDGQVSYVPIENITSQFRRAADGKEFGFPTKDIYVLTEKGFTRIKHVVRHFTTKSLYRVRTQRGFVDVTEDHSLLDPRGVKVKPTDVQVGSSLLHLPLSHYTDLHSNDCTLDTKRAFDLGTWYANQHSLSLRHQASTLLHAVPRIILNANKELKKNYMFGFLSVLNEESEKDGYVKLRIQGKVAAADLYFVMTALSWRVYLRPLEDNVYEIFCEMVPLTRSASNVINRITPLGQVTGYVYDIETENHHFNVGPGSLVVHNTDSVFIHFPGFSIMDTIRLSTIAEKLLTDSVFGRDPIRMEYEKVYLPYILIKKKNYIGKKFEQDDVKWKLDYKGIALKRRNYCPLLKEIYQGVIDNVLDDIDDTKGGYDRAVDVIRQGLRKLETGQTNYDELTITASTKDIESYANPNLPHVQLAIRMKERNDEVSVGDRISYVFIADFTKGTELSARSEEVLFAKEHKLPLDALYYLNQQIRIPISTIMTILGKGDEVTQLFNSSETIIRQRLDHLVQKGYRVRNGFQDISTFFNGGESSTKPLPPASRFKTKGKRTVKPPPTTTLDSFFVKKDPKS
jgi:DNA polymerase elongation subunit (family B)